MPRGYILQPTYRVRRGVPVVQLYGRLEDGRPFLIEDSRFRPYFFVRRQDAHLLAAQDRVRTLDVPACDLAGEPLVRVEVEAPGDVPPLRERLAEHGAICLEADIRFPYRYLIDHGVRAGIEIEGPADTREGLLCFRDPEVAPAELSPSLRFLSIDLETSPDASRIYSAALAGADVEEVLLCGRDVPGRAFVQSHPDEGALLEALMARIAEIDPDVLLGWNVVDFDLRVIARRCRALGIQERLGRGPGECALRQEPGFTRQWRADVPGRVVLDGIPLVRDALRLEDYRLETVARAVLGRGKRIDSEAPDAAAEITRMYHEDPAALAEYNLEDARLVSEILEREGLLALSIERSLLTGMPLDRIGASIASFDRLYLPALRERGVVAPSVDSSRSGVGIRGGAVLDSIPGLFRNVALFDFKSLYPSLIRTFYLDPLAHARADRSERRVQAPNGAHFAIDDEAILPGLIEQLMRRREAAKAREDRHADQAIKIMMNALFGVLGAASCRFFDPDVANAITTFGQQTLGWTRQAFEELGARVIYGDTDSVFVELGDERDPEDARRYGRGLRSQVESAIEQRVREEYRVEPRLTLELELVYERFFMPRVRGGSGGSKKRYAGWIGDRLEIVGLESVRRDWPAVAKRLQRGMLERLFREQDVTDFVRDVAARVALGELDEELVYVKRVRKGSLDRYTAATPPHVQAARKLGQTVGGVVRYVITSSGPEPVVPGRPLPPGIDHAHYRERVLRPVADAILPELDTSFDEALGAPRQLSLL